MIPGIFLMYRLDQFDILLMGTEIKKKKNGSCQSPQLRSTGLEEPLTFCLNLRGIALVPGIFLILTEAVTFRAQLF